MELVRAIRFVARLVGVVVGTLAWIVAVPVIEFGRGVVDTIRRRSASATQGERAEVERQPSAPRLRRSGGFDPARVRPIWTAAEPRPPGPVKKHREPGQGEHRKAS